MQRLADHLRNSTPPPDHASETNTLWTEFLLQLENGTDLESALQNCSLSNPLIDHIVNQTWSLISAADLDLFDKLISNRKYLQLSRLYSHLFDSTHKKISVVTTNYDRLAEYAADAAEFSHYTGFTNGYLRRSVLGRRLSRNHRNTDRTVNVWKVHGSLDWFYCPKNSIFAVASAQKIPTTSHPAIITPGSAKYEQTHQEPFRSIITESDVALRGASAYLCVGFGFNDKHIQSALVERWHEGDALLVIVTKELSEPAKQMLDQSNGNRFLAIEEAEAGTLVRSHFCLGGQILEDQNLWELESFLDEVL